MKVKVSAKNTSDKIRANFESVQLAVLNAERLSLDSKKVSIPTKMALIELGLEEVSKAMGMLLSFEKMEFDKDPTLMDQFFRNLHISKKKYNAIIPKMNGFLDRFFRDTSPEQFMQFFDEDSFGDHSKKIKFLSKFIEYTREFTIPLVRASSERSKLVRKIAGGYFKFEPNELKEGDKFIDKTLKINEKQLYDIIDIKNRGLYLARAGDIFVSPSSYTFITERAENLLTVLIAIVKNEVTIFADLKENYNNWDTIRTKQKRRS